MEIKEKLKEIKAQIPSSIEIVAATKTRSPAEIQAVVEAGIRIIGENTVQEAEKKYYDINQSIRNKAEWHMVGHLQRNKVKRAVEIFSCIQSVDSIKLAKEIDKRCEAIRKIMPILLEINIANETTKYGFKPEKKEIELILKEISQLDNIMPNGLMFVEPYCEDSEDSRIYFKKAKNLSDALKNQNATRKYMQVLSMGMSNSYKIAVEEGSNMIRLGTILFGPRKTYFI